MKVKRRQFLKLMGASTAMLALWEFKFLGEAEAVVPSLRIQYAIATPSICCYCSVGCGLTIHTDATTHNVINIEGDADHPINRGSLCSKGSSIFQLVGNTQRVTTPLYRAPGTNTWQVKTWEWTLDQIANKVKTTRDTYFETSSGGITVNRVDAIACLGGAALDNEEDYLLSKMMRALGVNYLEHQARL